MVTAYMLAAVCYEIIRNLIMDYVQKTYTMIVLKKIYHLYAEKGIVCVILCSVLHRTGRCGVTDQTAALLEVKEARWLRWGSHEHVSLVLVSYVDL